MIKSVIFDIDNTLYNYDHAHKFAFQALCEYAEQNLNMTSDEFTQAHKSVKKELDVFMKGHSVMHNRLVRYQNILEQAHLPLVHAVRMNDLYWNTLMEHMEPEPGAAELIKILKNQKIRIGIGSDMTSRIQLQKLETLGILGSIDFIVTSEEALAEKPSPALFELCQKKAGCNAEECIFVGDSLKKDAAGAANAGMHGVWYNYKPETIDSVLPDHITEINKLSELENVIIRINDQQ